MYSVLVVDDEPRHRSGLANMIRELRPDYKVYEAKNGSVALDFVKSNSVDMIITDIKMPIMDGLQFIENLGRKTKEIKIIILSAYGSFEYAQKAISLGAFDYLLKPFEDEKVIAMLGKVEAEIERENLEKQVDNGGNLSAISLSGDAGLSSGFEEGLLGGTVTIKGKAYRVKENSWGDHLYRPVEVETEPVELKAVPYLLWGNRKPGEMLVWINYRLT